MLEKLSEVDYMARVEKDLRSLEATWGCLLNSSSKLRRRTSQRIIEILWIVRGILILKSTR
jgi:hypothetical protein